MEKVFENCNKENKKDSRQGVERNASQDDRRYF